MTDWNASLMPLVGVVPGPGLLFGLMLVAAIIGGYLAHFVRVPRVIGFLLGGAALRGLLGALLDPGPATQTLVVALGPLEAVKDLALGLILFSIGRVFERAHIRTVGKRVLKISALEISLVLATVLVGCGIACVLVQRGDTVGDNLILALFLALAGIATAPAATLYVLREYDAKGPNTDTILSLVGLNNIVCIVLFYVVFQVLASVGWIDVPEKLIEHPWLGLAMTTVGSVLLGIIFGTLISMIHAKLPLAEVLLIFIALFIVLGAGEKWLLEHAGVSYNFLLTSMVIGAVFFNVALEPQKLETAVHTMGAPIFAGFFTMAGFELHLRDLLHLGWVGGAYVVCRSAAKYYGCRAGRRWAKAEERLSPQLGSALLCQAAVVIGLSVFIKRNWQHDSAERFSTIILGSIVVFELIGPLLIKRTVRQGGEVKAVTLLRRIEPRGTDVSVLRLTLQAFGRLLGIGRRAAADIEPESLQVKHIMRTNVPFIRESDTLDEVLHFVERSTYAHFPVVGDKSEYVGVIHFNDVREMIYDPVLADLVTAEDLADSAAPTVWTQMPLGELLRVFERHNVGSLPVVESKDSKRIVGLVEQRDLLRTLHRSTA